MNVSVCGDENEIQIQVGDKTFLGDLFQAADDPDDDGSEIWEIDGLQIETEQILCKASLEDLAREFLLRRSIPFSSITVTSDSFRE